MTGYLVAAPDFGPAFDTDVLGVNVPNSDMPDVEGSLRSLGKEPLDVLIASRVAKVLLETPVFGIVLGLLRRRFDTELALVGGALIAMGPFIIGHDRVLQIDCLFAMTSLAAVLALSRAADAGPDVISPWAWAGALGALAWLTRVSGLVLVAVVAVTVVIDLLDERKAGSTLAQSVKRWIRALATWLLTAAIVSLVLWPAWLVAPIATAKRFVNNVLSMGTTEGHLSGTFFMGDTSPNPGPLFYPSTMLWRSSWVETVGLMLSAIVVMMPGLRRAIGEKGRRVLGILALFAVMYVLAMTMGAKKFDRYLLPVYPILCVFAATGFVIINREFRSRKVDMPRLVSSVALGAVLALQGWAGIAARPYYLESYNTLLGGAADAEDVMPMGWGEGGFAAAAFIISESEQVGRNATDPPMVRVPWSYWTVSWALPTTFSVVGEPIRTIEDWE